MPIVVPGLSTGSSSKSTTSLPQDSVDSTFRPAITRSQSTSSPELEDQFRESNQKNKNRDEDIDMVQGDLVRDLPEWLEEFTENLVNGRVPALRDTPASSSREGQYFMTIHDVEMAKLGCPGPCREYTLPGDSDLSRPKGWIRGNTEIGPALEVTVTYHRGRYGIEIRIDSMQNDGSQSWVVISRGMNKYVTRMPEGIEESPDNVEANATNSTPAQHQAS